MPVSELDADKNPVRGYVLGNEYISQVNGTSFGYYLNDEQGSVRYLTESDGSIRNHYRYSAFGETITAEETVPNRLRYNGQMADGLTGLYYLRARYYNASLGRFTQEDVIYNDGLNLYAYCNSNPVMYSDPSGFAKQCDPKVGGEKDSKSGTDASFTWKLRGEDATLDDVKVQEISYVKRNSTELKTLRDEFNTTTRKAFLEDLGNNAEYLRNAGFSETDILKIKNGRVPDGWQVHHKLPLDGSGTNSFDNLVLIQNEPYHKVITNYQNSIARQMEIGEIQVVQWPMPNGNIYPAQH